MTDKANAFIDDIMVGLYACIGVAIYDGFAGTPTDQALTKTFFILVGAVAVAIRRLR